MSSSSFDLETFPSNRWIPLSGCRSSLFEDNLHAICENHPNLGAVLDACFSRNDLYLRKSSRGFWDAGKQIDEKIELLITAQQVQQNVPRLEQMAKTLLHDVRTSLVLSLGFDLGSSLQKLLPVLKQHSNAALAVIEPNADLLACSLAIIPLKPYMETNRIFWIVGEDFESQLEKHFQQHYWFAASKIDHVMAAHAVQPFYRAHWSCLKESMMRFRQKYQTWFQQQMEETERYYRERESLSIRKILAPFHGEGMAIQYIQKRFLDECRRRDIEIIDFHPSFQSETALLCAIARERPDAMLLINRPPGEYTDASIVNRFPMPRVVWVMDDPNSFIGESLHDNDFVLLWDFSYEDDLKAKGALSVDHFPYVADMDEAKPSYRECFASPVGFIGQVKAFDPSEYDFDDDTAALVQDVAQNKVEGLDREYEELVWERQDEFGLRILNSPKEPLPRFVRYGIYTVANALRRIQVLERAMPFGLRLYGNEDWLKVLGSHPLAECYAGPADPQADVPDIFFSTTINLNIHSLHALTSLNQRDFNCPLVGGFLLTDWVEEADTFFVPGREMAFYRSLDELEEKIEYYLDHKEERDAMIQHGRERVIRDHTYNVRVPRILQTLEQRFEERYRGAVQ